MRLLTQLLPVGTASTLLRAVCPRKYEDNFKLNPPQSWLVSAISAVQI